MHIGQVSPSMHNERKKTGWEGFIRTNRLSPWVQSSLHFSKVYGNNTLCLLDTCKTAQFLCVKVLQVYLVRELESITVKLKWDLTV